jgi:protocatechuate 3,4-dioxygenase alpha subunit
MTSTDETRLPATPGQTVGPFFHFGLNYVGMNHVVAPGSAGAVRLSGVIRDGAGEPVPDALIEIFGADADGSIPQEPGSLDPGSKAFTGFGRAATDDAGAYEFWTRAPGSSEGRAAFFAVTLFARGLPSHLHTRIYVPGTPLANDALMASLSNSQRETLVAIRGADGNLQHDIHLQGNRETVFLDY